MGRSDWPLATGATALARAVPPALQPPGPKRPLNLPSEPAEAVYKQYHARQYTYSPPNDDQPTHRRIYDGPLNGQKQISKIAHSFAHIQRDDTCCERDHDERGEDHEPKTGPQQ